jgi:polysaccharide biosynthesis protein PslH
MNVLVIAHRLPYPPDKGDKIRSYNQVKFLADRHAVWCACLIDDPDDWRHVPALRGLCRDVAVIRLRKPVALARSVIALLTGGSATEGYFGSPALAREIRKWSEQVRFDAVLAFSSGTARYGLDVQADRKVLDLCDVDSAKWTAYAQRSAPPARWLYRLEAARLARREWELACRYDQTTVVSRREAELFESVCSSLQARHPGVPRPRHLVVPNGIDTDAFRFHEGPVEEPVVGFVGTMDYPPNVDAVCWFADQMWPRIQAERPDATFLIVGRSPDSRVLALRQNQGIEVTGQVPDVREYLVRMKVCIAPMRIAHGVQNKVLEAMATGRPSVVTSIVADGIGVSDGQGIVIADQADDFARQVASLLGDSARCRQVGNAGRNHVEKMATWTQTLGALEKALGLTGNEGAS